MSVAAPSPLSSTAPLPIGEVTERTISSRVLGELTVPSTQLFSFPEGLHGFAEHTEFVLVPAARDGFWWLQSTDEAGLAFLLVDPFTVAPGYEVDLSDGDQRFLKLNDSDDALTLAVVTLPADNTGAPTTNLRGPIVLNVKDRLGRQVVRGDDRYGLQVPVPLGA